MRHSTAQPKRYALWLWTTTTETEKGLHRGEDQGRFDCISLEGQTKMYMLTNMDPSPAKGNLSYNRNHPVKTHIVEWYNQHMGSVNNSDRMANSYSISRRTFKWTMKLFSHLLDLWELNSWILLPSCGAKYTHRDFRFLLVRNLIEEAWKSQDHSTPQIGWKTKCGHNMFCNSSHHNKHWPAKSSNKLRCCLCSFHGHREGTVYKCARHVVGLCMVSCFVEYHTTVNL